MSNDKIETTDMVEAVNHSGEQAFAAPSHHKGRRTLTEDEAEAEFAAFTRSLGVEPEDW